MFRPNWKTLLIGAVLMTMLVVGSSTANAWWGYHHQASWACSPCYAPCTVAYRCDPCGNACGEWYLGYRPGPIRRALFGSCRWYYSGCGTRCGWGCTTCGTANTCCDEAATDTRLHFELAPETPTLATPEETPDAAEPDAAEPDVTEPDVTVPELPPLSVPTTPSPLDPPAVDPLPPVPTTPMAPLTPFNSPTETPDESPMGGAITPLPEARNVPTPANSGLLTIWVPYDAKVTINGLATKSIGSRRQYVSYDLKPGFNYRYEVRAELVRDGRVYEDVRVVTMTAGARSAVAFGFNINPHENLASVR